MALRQNVNRREAGNENNSKKMSKDVCEEENDQTDDSALQIDDCEIVDKSSVNEFMIMVSKCEFNRK